MLRDNTEQLHELRKPQVRQKEKKVLNIIKEVEVKSGELGVKH